MERESNRSLMMSCVHTSPRILHHSATTQLLSRIFPPRFPLLFQARIHGMHPPWLGYPIASPAPPAQLPVWGKPRSSNPGGSEVLVKATEARVPSFLVLPILPPSPGKK